MRSRNPKPNNHYFYSKNSASSHSHSNRKFYRQMKFMKGCFYFLLLCFAPCKNNK